jgi:hypothetical protein
MGFESSFAASLLPPPVLVFIDSNTDLDGQERAKAAGFEALPIGIPAIWG